MNLSISAGKDKNSNEVKIDLATHRFILLTGSTGTGKSIFHNSIYKQLVEQNSPDEIGLIFLDMTRVDFSGWQSPYILANETSMEKAIEILESLAKVKGSKSHHTVIQIEECDMFVNFSKRAEDAMQELLATRKDITFIYSTSRPGGSALSPLLLSLIDTKIVFELASDTDLKYVLGPSADTMPHKFEKILMNENKTTLLKPFPKEQADILSNFSLTA